MSLAHLARQVHAVDKARARALIRKALQEAGEQWIPIDALSEALVEELAGLGRQATDRYGVAAYLRHVAEVIETSAREVACVRRQLS